MSAPQPANPSPQTKLDNLQQSAEQHAATSDGGSTSESCQGWTFKLQAISQETDWPASDVEISLCLSGDNVAEQVVTEKLTATEGSQKSVSGTGSKDYYPSVECARWKMVESSPESIQLPAFNGGLLKVFIKKKPWVQFNVQLDGTTNSITPAQWKLKLPGSEAASARSQTSPLLDCELEQDGTCDVVELKAGGDDEIWELAS